MLGKNPHFKGEGKPYFWWCEACNTYEYDCHGSWGCITKHPDYEPPRTRATKRRMKEQGTKCAAATLRG